MEGIKSWFCCCKAQQPAAGAPQPASNNIDWNDNSTKCQIARVTVGGIIARELANCEFKALQNRSQPMKAIVRTFAAVAFFGCALFCAIESIFRAIIFALIQFPLAKCGIISTKKDASFYHDNKDGIFAGIAVGAFAAKYTFQNLNPMTTITVDTFKKLRGS